MMTIGMAASTHGMIINRVFSDCSSSLAVGADVVADGVVFNDHCVVVTSSASAQRHKNDNRVGISWWEAWDRA